MTPEQLLASLETRIKDQLTYEFHEEERRKYEWENMTVARLLEMLAYMLDDET